MKVLSNGFTFLLPVLFYDALGMKDVFRVFVFLRQGSAH